MKHRILIIDTCSSISQTACTDSRREREMERDGDRSSGRAREGLKRIFEDQIIGILGVSTAVNRVDTNEGTYAQEVYESSSVLAQVPNGPVSVLRPFSPSINMADYSIMVTYFWRKEFLFVPFAFSNIALNFGTYLFNHKRGI